MISRRKFVAALPVAAVALGQPGLARPSLAQPAEAEKTAAPSAANPASAQPAASQLPCSRYVKIRIGTGGHGHTYPGATVPFGMVQLSPDTYNDDWDWCSGYNYADNSIMGFSHTHLSGTGVGDMLDVLLMPRVGEVKTEPSSRDTPERGYRSRFSHDTEVLEPGYYAVFLRDGRIQAELTATTRAGFHRYTFPKSDQSHFILDLSHAYGGPKAVSATKLHLVGTDTVVGSRTVSSWARAREIFFAVKFSKSFRSVDYIAEGATPGTPLAELEVKARKLVLHYETADKETLLVKTGISGVSIEGALKNLDAEIPAWDFDKVRSDAASLWERELSRIQVEGGTERQKQIFYTSLYHCLLAPTLFDDVDGRYRGMDSAVHTLAPGQHNYSTFSLWDTYRALHPLFTLAQQDRVPGMVNCLIRMANESPRGMPVWPLQARETSCMTGYHSVVVIAEAVQKGFPGIDLAALYGPLRRRAMDDDYLGFALYRQLGYIPCDLKQESIGRGLDYAYDDWAAAHIAQATGHTADATLLFQRAASYRNFFSAKTGFMTPRLASGDFAEPFTPSEVGHSTKWVDYTESNAWQATFAVQHDPRGLANLLGGPDKLEARLDALFNASSALPPDATVDIAGLVGQYAHGNEPSHHIAYLYVYAGAPYKTQQRVASLMETMYENQPDGIAGNEDCGQMSAWYCMSAMGFYAVDPVSTNYVLGTPIFDRVSVTLGNGRKLMIEAHRQAADAIYIHSVTLNGKPLERAWFAHREIAQGGRLVFTMSAEPNRDFGRSPAAAPPSMSA